MLREYRLMFTCEICANTNNNQLYVAREMMFGFRDEFEYFRCAACGCLQLSTVPVDLARYYPEDYSPFQNLNLQEGTPLKQFLLRQRTNYLLGRGNLLGKILAKVTRPGEHFDWLSQLKLELDFDILDVGCGAGKLLLNLRKEGFEHLTGIDRFVREDLNYPNGVKVIKQEIAAVQKEYDFVILQHSFEHMLNPHEVIKNLYRVLKPNRYALLRIPVFSDFIWQKYGTSWVQLDAPRHLFLHTARSMKILADKAGFQISRVVYDSTPFQFWASEQYLQDIPLMDSRSYFKNPDESIFSKAQIEAFTVQADQLNREEDGDQASFYLYKG